MSHSYGKKQVRQFYDKTSVIIRRLIRLYVFLGGPDSLALLHFLWNLKEQKISHTIIAAQG